MKLAAQYTRASMLVTAIILLFGGCIYYTVVTYVADKQFDHELAEELGEMNEFIQSHQRFPKPFEFDSYQAKFEPTGAYIHPLIIVDTMISPKTQVSRAIIGNVELKGVNYRITIVEPKEATNNLIQLISFITLGLTLVLFAALFFTNRILLNGLWKPFYKLLDRLDNFSHTGRFVSNQATIRTDEFRKLQSSIEKMENQANAEYETLQSFTENASHEMMTPIAVITSKLDNLIQDESITEKQLTQLQDIYNAGDKLSRLGESLLLLIKIDHELIREKANLWLDSLVNEKISQFNEISARKSIVLTTFLQPVSINASPYLIDILLNNLISNAIRHTSTYGNVRIDVDQYHFKIANTGQAALDVDKIFERFQKSPVSEGTGLGLTIARNICESYGWTLVYLFEPPFHCFVIRF